MCAYELIINIITPNALFGTNLTKILRAQNIRKKCLRDLFVFPPQIFSADILCAQYFCTILSPNIFVFDFHFASFILVPFFSTWQLISWSNHIMKFKSRKNGNFCLSPLHTHTSLVPLKNSAWIIIARIRHLVSISTQKYLVHGHSYHHGDCSLQYVRLPVSKVFFFFNNVVVERKNSLIFFIIIFNSELW